MHLEQEGKNVFCLFLSFLACSVCFFFSERKRRKRSTMKVVVHGTQCTGWFRGKKLSTLEYSAYIQGLVQ